MVKSTGHRVKLGPPSKGSYTLLVIALVAFSLGGGYMAAVLPTGSGWRLFSWHPFLMTSSFVGMFGIGAVTKKLGGYSNTKLHGILSWLGIFMAFGGLYAIYLNKENNGYEHLQSAHSILGVAVMASCFGAGMIGGVVLHPDFGVDKTNKTIRFAHKMFSRLALMTSWATAIYGLIQVTDDPLVIAAYGLPLVALVPFTLI